MMPTCAAIAWAVALLSPVSITAVTPSAFKSATAWMALGLRVSATANTASTRVLSASIVTLRPCSSCLASAASSAGLHSPLSCIQRWLPKRRLTP